MKVVICWTRISGYMAACWKALAAMPGVELFALAISAQANRSQIAFTDTLLSGIPHRLLTPEDADNADLVHRTVVEQKPDVVVVAGWSRPAYVALPFSRELRDVPFVMGMDTPWKDNWRQRLARLRIGRFLDRMSAVVTAGERTWQYAKRLGIPEDRIGLGVYGFDAEPLADLWARRCALPEGWPRRFLFVGRYVPEKAIDVLVDAYRQYRLHVSDPWSMTCCGMGPLASLLQGADGVTDAGFVQPADQPPVFLNHGALILPSRYEPWGVVVAEACGAGLPVICSHACGAAVDLLRPYYNGLYCATGCAASLTEAMTWIHHHHEELPAMGQRSMRLAEPYSAAAWARRWHETLLRVVPCRKAPHT